MAEENKAGTGGIPPWLRSLAFFGVAAFVLVRYPAAFKAAVGIGIVVMVHELGHFLVAKASGIRVLVFSLGWGSPLVSFERGGTRYQIAPIPLGGFMKPAGEFEDEDASGAPIQHAPDDFLAKPWHIRLLVAVAGPAMNFLAPVLVLFILYATLGRPFFIAPPLVMDVDKGSPAEAAGMRPGDQIIKVDGEWVTEPGMLGKKVDAASRQHPQEKTHFLMLRDSQQIELDAQPRLDTAAGRYLLGIHYNPGPAPQRRVVKRVLPSTPAEKAGFRTGDEILSVGGVLLNAGDGFPQLFAAGAADAKGEIQVEFARDGKTMSLGVPQKQSLPGGLTTEMVGLLGLEFEYDASLVGRDEKQYQRLGLVDSAKIASLEVAFRIRFMAQGIWELVFGHMKLKESVQGPVAIARMANQEAKTGFVELVLFMVNISLILGIMNLLPLPLLDGGTFVFCLIEGARGKALSTKTQALLQNISGALLLALVAYATFNDVGSLFHTMLKK